MLFPPASTQCKKKRKRDWSLLRTSGDDLSRYLLAKASEWSRFECPLGERGTGTLAMWYVWTGSVVDPNEEGGQQVSLLPVLRSVFQSTEHIYKPRTQK
jgi:hypothetical protein